MPAPSRKILLLFSRVIVVFCLFMTFVFACQLLGLTYDALTEDSEVQLNLDTTWPNSFAVFYSGKAGFEDAKHNQPNRMRQSLLPPMLHNAAGFELAADPHKPVLRYKEPNAWKRLALLHLGASDKMFSLSWILFLGIGSWQLWRLLLDVTPATPFTRANSRRLARLALLVLSLSIVQTISYLAIRSLVPTLYSPDLVEPLSHYVSLNTEYTLPGTWVGVMLAVIAAVYRRGVELSQEAELVI